MSRTSSVLALAGATLLAAACGSPGGDPAPPADPSAADVTVVAEDVRYVDPPGTLPAGTTTIAVVNEGSAPHDVTFEGVDASRVAAGGGETAAGAVTLEPGTYTVYCSVPGHRQAGMEFTIEVR